MDIDERVELSSYNEEWEEIFLAEKDLIAKHLSDIHIEHIGSTSVKGMVAKPIIDIMIGVQSYPPPSQIITTLEQLGYYNFGENDRENGRLYFAKRGLHNFNVHVVQYQGVLWRNNILFREYLKAHADEAQQYCDLKKEIINKGNTKLLSYSRGKEKFISQIIKKLNNMI